MKYTVTVNGKVFEVEVVRNTSGYSAAADAVPSATVAAPAPVPKAAPAAAFKAPPSPAVSVSAPAAAAGEKVVNAPMPGNILDIRCSAGQGVHAGDVLFILEAMKMEIEVVAPADGTISEILTSKGIAVDPTDVLCVIA